MCTLRKHDARLRESVKEHQAKASRDAGNAKVPDEALLSEDAQLQAAESRVARLLQETQELAAKNCRDREVVNRLLASKTLQTVVFQSKSSCTEEEANLKQALLYRDSKVKEQLRLEAEHRQAREKLTALKLQSASLMEENRELQMMIAQQIGPQDRETDEGTLRSSR